MTAPLTRKNFTGPWVGLPVAWLGDDDRFDEAAYRDDVRRCCLARQFGPAGLIDSACDRLCGTAIGILQTCLRVRGPYPSATPEDADILKEWCRRHFPEILDTAPAP